MIAQSVMEALVVLGSSADEVADRLAALGFKGQRGVSGDCPVARYLQATLHLRNLTVGTAFCEVGSLSHPLPEAVRTFLVQFDTTDKYPLLVDDALAHAPGCLNLPDLCTCER